MAPTMAQRTCSKPAQAALPGQMGRGDHQLLNGVDPRGTVGAREEPPRRDHGYLSSPKGVTC